MPRDLDGSNYFTIADAPEWDDIPFLTISWWSRKDGQADWQIAGPIRFRDNANERYFGLVYAGGGGNIRCDTSPDGTFYAGNAGEAAHGMANDRWYHCALVSAPGYNRIYVGGAAVMNDTSITPGIGDSTSQPIHLGFSSSYAAVARGANAKWADCVIWRSPLNDHEVLGLAKGAAPGSIRPYDYLGHWPLWAIGTREVNLARSAIAGVATGSPAAYATTMPPLPPPVPIAY
jgi:hypothetical protein